MPLARTPPQHARLPARHDTFSPSQAFVEWSSQTPAPDAGPSRPPPKAGAGAVEAVTPSRKRAREEDGADVDAPQVMAVDQAQREDVDMDEADAEATMGAEPVPGLSTPRATTQQTAPTPARTLAHIPKTPSRTSATSLAEPAPEPIASSSTAPARPPAEAPVPKTPAQKSAEILARPAVPIEGADESAHGRHYEAFMRVLRINTLDRGIGKWSLENMKECFPLLEAYNPTAMKNTWRHSNHVLRERIMEDAEALISGYNVAPALQMLSDVVDQARADAKSGSVRRDAWSPDFTPQQVMAAQMLGTYDAAWARLRAEALELHADVAARAAALSAKQQQLATLEAGVSDGVVDLNKAIEALGGFPTEDMLAWIEDAETKLVTR